MAEFPLVQVVPFTNTAHVRWSDGKPRCARHHGVCLVKARLVGIDADGFLCHVCGREVTR